MKSCSKCGEIKGELEFYSGRADCKDCKRSTTNKHYAKTAGVRVSYSKLRRNRRKLQCIEYLGGECEDCGGKYHQACYDFHHLDESSKEANIGELLSASWEVIQEELDKCILLCSNCHRIRHFK